MPPAPLPGRHPQVRSADIVVAIHGAGCTQGFYMREGTAHLEIRPHEFGSKYSVSPACLPAYPTGFCITCIDMDW